MKVVFLSYDDYANLAYNQSESLKRIGVNSQSFKLVPHTFNYTEESLVISDSKMVIEASKSDVVVIMHSNLKVASLVKHLKKKFVVYHTGSEYRGRPSFYNELFNPFVHISLTDQCEFMQLGAKNLFYNAAAIDVNKIQKFGHQVTRPYKVAHYPSNQEVKGTQQIREMLASVVGNYKFLCSVDKVTHKEQMKRMDDCDVYVELFKPELRGKPYGCFGVTAFEAAAAGKIVVTNNIHENVYKDAYGKCALQIANTKEDFISKMNLIVNLDANEISKMQTESYYWMLDKHSYEANGQRLKELFQL